MDWTLVLLVNWQQNNSRLWNLPPHWTFMMAATQLSLSLNHLMLLWRNTNLPFIIRAFHDDDYVVWVFCRMMGQELQFVISIFFFLLLTWSSFSSPPFFSPPHWWLQHCVSTLSTWHRHISFQYETQILSQKFWDFKPCS